MVDKVFIISKNIAKGTHAVVVRALSRVTNPPQRTSSLPKERLRGMLSLGLWVNKYLIKNKRRHRVSFNDEKPELSQVSFISGGLILICRRAYPFDVILE